MRIRSSAVVTAVVAVLGVAAALVVAPMLSTGANGGERGEGPTTIRSTLAGQSVRLSLPGPEPKGVVVWFHGQGGNVNDRVDGPWLDALRRDGWAVASSEFHSQSWGNAASTKDTRLLQEWAEKQAGAEVRLWVSGSMGASIALNALTHGVQAPPCWYGVKPALDLTRMDQVPGGPGYIRRAYGGGPVPADRNPIDNVDRLPTETRYRVVSSKQDEWVAYDENTQPLVEQLRSRGADITLLDVKGGHADPSHWNARDLVAYADSCAGKA
ncbi:hypothetical protein GGQ22_18490 [Nocardioides sp. zg-579]|uniref:Alpha/beta hydrolase n=1 Tax=Nocardioides marmotae TaxID=2663857 RepID=A0A6I3JGJ0_9ACTN|nr:hypothetical protein [Nocardioides marmotae]MCR6033405.1 hypothetical protein [Gordonia jinghuaiqii]MTB97063.1 hypothetical protein [Nocardioides marmotae]QKE00720.1 hypothetical protein HPC71_06255 [Nocardioides marmotae]